LYQGLILEGISGTGKSAVLESLLAHPHMQQLPALSRLVLTEHHTQRVLEILEQQEVLDSTHHISLLEDLVSFIERMQSRTSSRGWNEPGLQSYDLFFLMERFHLTHVFRFPDMNWNQVAHIDQRMRKIGAVLCLLTVDADILEERLFSRENTCWLRYLKRYGETPDAVVNAFMQRQTLAIRLAEQSSLPSIQLNTSHLSIAELTEALVRCLFPVAG
jgi:thymidylate kinase